MTEYLSKSDASPLYLRDDVIAEPLINQWYAWSYLIPPAPASRFLTHSQIKVLTSFVESPDVHVAALRDPNMIGGPFMQYGADRRQEVESLLKRTQSTEQAKIALSQAIADLDALLAAHPAGEPLGDLYSQVPDPLRGYVELVYDTNDHASVRYQEGLLYRSEYYTTDNQSIALRIPPDSDRRAFVLSTPRLELDTELLLTTPFANPALDALFCARHTPANIDALAEQLQLNQDQYLQFTKLFTSQAPRASQAYQGDDVRVRYMGHACVLIETQNTCILIDPLISYEHAGGMERFSYNDLPNFIDYVLITHNHQDHVMLETLLQIRHKIGRILIPSSQRGSLIDPSLRMTLKKIGFTNVQELDVLEPFNIADGEIIGLPFLGEHGDLDIATKAAWRVEVLGRSIMCVADSDNIENELYEHIARLYDNVDILFLGMECEGAPYTWAYGPLLPNPVSRQQSRARRLNGSDCDRGMKLVKRLHPKQVYVYAMGQEPWLNYITSIHYTEESLAIVESNKLVAKCADMGLLSRRLLGRAEFELPKQELAPRQSVKLPARMPSSTEVRERLIDTPKKSLIKTPAAPTAPVINITRNDPLSDLFDELHRLNILLHVKNGKLKVNAPKGSLNTDLTSQIKQLKPEIMELLQRDAGSGEGSKSTATLELPEDARLSSDIQPLARQNTKQDGPILLTGATGFVGAFLLHALIQQTTQTIHCLVRCDQKNNSNAGIARLRKAMRHYKLWDEGFVHRIHVIAGDLSQPHFGLSDSHWHQLAKAVRVIYHNGARVHHMMPYEQLRNANVMGTIEALKLCCIGDPKTLHYLSSLSVLPPLAQAQGQQFLESDPLPVHPVPTGGYNRTKWTAEHLVRQAFERGLSGTIHRPGPVSGDSINGAFNDNDFLYRLLQGYIQLGSVPTGEMPIDLLPVDYLAKAIVYLSRHPKADGQNFHLLHPQAVSSNELFIACSTAGYPLQRIAYGDWFKELQNIARNSPDHALYPLVALFASRQEQEKIQTKSSNAHALPYATNVTQTLLEEADFSLPELNQDLFTIYIRAMKQSGTLGESVK